MVDWEDAMTLDLEAAKPPASTAFATRLARATPLEDGDLTWAPAWRLREMIAARKVSAVEVTEHFLNRIEALNPRLHPFRQVDAVGARAQAKKADAAVMAGAPLGPLHGVPIALKEFLAIEGLSWWNMRTSGHETAPRDSIETERLRAAGAVIVGPTVAGLVAREFGASDRMPLNPWDTERVCGDSSSGSACAAASAMTPLTIAGDGLGSTRLPASFCGLVGLHPTRGLLPSFDWTQLNPRPMSTYGPLTRDVRDAATVLSVLAGPDGRDMMCLPGDPPDYLSALDDGAKGMRLLWTDDWGYGRAFGVAETPRVIDTVRAAALRLAGVGAKIEETLQVFENPAASASQWLRSDPALASRQDPPVETVVKVRQDRQRVWNAMRAALNGWDFILSPTILSVAPTRETWGEQGMTLDFAGRYTTLTAVANFLGWPAISVPAGLVDGLPVGLQIFGRPNSEPRMLQLAQAFLAVQE
jgi:aspartyl-tRNA(Asn)/glutamyl-tRNA(Gln) amidotransferase subunit A